MTNQRIWIASLVLTALGLLLMLTQHWGMTFTNSDDPWIVQLGYDHGLVEGSIEAAKAQGRFWLVPILILAQIPLLPDSWELVNTIRILTNGLVFFSFVVFCIRLTNKFAGILMGLVWLALIDINSSDFSPIHGFLWMFNLQFIFLFTSFYIFLGKIKTGEMKNSIVTPYLLYGFALLAYEPMIFYALVYPFLYWYKLQVKGVELDLKGILEHAKIFAEKNIALGVVIILYLALFFGFRKWFATGLRGIEFGGSLLEILRTIFGFSVHGFHFQVKPLTSLVLEQYTQSSVLLAVIFASLVGMAMILAIPKIKDQFNPVILSRRNALLVLVFFVISPNILFGFVEGYRQWALADPHYVGNYFSSFPLAMVIVLLVLNLVGGDKAKHERVLFMLAIYVFSSAACDNFLRWEKLAETNRRGSAQWQAALEQLNKYPFAKNRKNLVCAGKTPNNVTGDDKYWSKYLSRKYSVDITFVSKKISTDNCDVVLNLQRNLA